MISRHTSDRLSLDEITYLYFNQNIELLLSVNRENQRASVNLGELPNKAIGSPLPNLPQSLNAVLHLHPHMI